MGTEGLQVDFYQLETSEVQLKTLKSEFDITAVTVELVDVIMSTWCWSDDDGR